MCPCPREDHRPLSSLFVAFRKQDPIFWPVSWSNNMHQSLVRKAGHKGEKMGKISCQTAYYIKITKSSHIWSLPSFHHFLPEDAYTKKGWNSFLFVCFSAIFLFLYYQNDGWWCFSSHQGKGNFDGHENRLTREIKHEMTHIGQPSYI